MTDTRSETTVPQWDVVDRMAKALREAGMTAPQMAEYLDVHRNTISGYLHGHRAPKRALLILWALRTGVPLEWLQGQPTAPQPTGSDEGLDDQCAVRELNPQPAD